MKLEDEDSDTSVLDYGINEAEVNVAIRGEFGGRLDLSNLPIEVAVKNAWNIKCPGRMPTSVRGIGAIITSGVIKSLNQATTSTYIRTSTAAKAIPISLNT